MNPDKIWLISPPTRAPRERALDGRLLDASLVVTLFASQLQWFFFTIDSGAALSSALRPSPRTGSHSRVCFGLLCFNKAESYDSVHDCTSTEKMGGCRAMPFPRMSKKMLSHFLSQPRFSPLGMFHAGDPRMPRPCRTTAPGRTGGRDGRRGKRGRFPLVRFLPRTLVRYHRRMEGAPGAA